MRWVAVVSYWQLALATTVSASRWLRAAFAPVSMRAQAALARATRSVQERQWGSKRLGC